MRLVLSLTTAISLTGCIVPVSKTVSGEEAMTVIANRCATQLGIDLSRPITADWDTATNAVGFDYPNEMTEDQKLEVLFCTQDKVEGVLAKG